MFWNLPDDESSRVESIHDYQEREADEGRREKRIEDYERYVHPQHAEPESEDPQ